MTFKKFLKEYQYEDWYLSNTVPEEMMAELVVPSVLACGHVRSIMEAEVTAMICHDILHYLASALASRPQRHPTT